MKITHIKKAVAVILVGQTDAFSAPVLRHEARIQSSTELMGLRSFLKRKLSRSRKGQSISPISEEGYHIVQPRHSSATDDDMLFSKTIKASSHARSVGHMPMQYTEVTVKVDAMASASPQLPLFEELEIPTLSTMTLDRKGNIMDERHTLPPIGDRQLTILAAEFREMLTYFSQYTQRDIMAVGDPRMRVIFQGIAASFGIPEVYRAFEILFEDYAPLRIAGRLIYGKLKNVMEEAQLQRRKQVDSVAELTGLSKEEIEASRSAYFKLVVHEDDTATEMTLQQIVDFGLAEMAVEVLGYENFDDFVKSLNPCKMQKVDFERLMFALQSCPIGDPSPECNPSTLLQEIAGRLESRTFTAKDNTAGQKKGKLNERYDGMVERFREWKSLVPSGDGRRLEILRGCFVGAESDEIVEALRVVYIDFSALRMSGDLIFKVMATLVGRKGS
jgi:hypothetical protein